MLAHTMIAATNIQEKMDAVPGSFHVFMISVMAAVVGMGIPSLIIWLRYKISGKDTNIAVGFFSVIGIVLTINVLGLLPVHEKKDELREAVRANVLENIDLQDETISLQNNGQRVTVFGSTQHGYVEFDMKYNADHDLMMPIHDGTQHIEIPVKDGSQLEEVTQ